MNIDTFQTILKMLFWIAPITIGFCLALGAYREKLEAVKERAAALLIRVESVENRISNNEISVAEIKKDIDYIKDSLSRIEKKLDER